MQPPSAASYSGYNQRSSSLYMKGEGKSTKHKQPKAKRIHHCMVTWVRKLLGNLKVNGKKCIDYTSNICLGCIHYVQQKVHPKLVKTVILMG